MWIKINGNPVQAMEIEKVLVLDWFKMNNLLNMDRHDVEVYALKHPGYLTSFFVVVLMRPQSTGLNSWSRMKYFSEPFPILKDAEQVRDDLLTKLNAIEIQIENFNINPKYKNDEIGS